MVAPLPTYNYARFVEVGFTKLFGGLVFSTVWQEPMHVRVVWITLLALADRNGFVSSSIPGLSSAARVTMDECAESIARLSGPDPYSRTKDHEGRRIAEVDGGWLVLNYIKYRESDNGGKAKNDTEGYVYFIGEPGGQAVKIGFSKNPWARLNALRTTNRRLKVMATQRGTMQDEHDLHRRFAADKVEGEWFKVGSAVGSYMDSLPGSDRSDEIATEAEAHADTKAKRKTPSVDAPRQSWLAPFVDAYRESEGEAPVGEMGKALKPIREQLGDTQTLDIFRHWLASPDVKYGVTKFGQRWKQYLAGPPRQGGKPTQQDRNFAVLKGVMADGE